MNRVLVTGASGFLGTALLERLVDEASYSLVAAVRREVPDLILGVQPILVSDLGANTDWSLALTDIDVVIHTAARVHVMNDSSSDPLTEFRKVNFEGTMNLARQAVQAGVKRFIFISSIKVNGEETKSGKPFTADDIPKPIDPYGISKAETEQALLKLASSTGLEIVIIRPVLVYGPGVKANFHKMMQWLSRGIPLPLGFIQNKRSLVALDNLVDLIFTCIDHTAAVNQVFLVSDDEDLTTTELLRRVKSVLGCSVLLIPVPTFLLKIAAWSLGKQAVSQRLLGSLQVDITKTKNLLNWKPPVSVDKALYKTAQAFLQQCRNQAGQ